MNVEIGRKRFTYSRVFTTADSPEEIKSGVYDQFGNFGTIEEFTCSEPLKHDRTVKQGNDTYELSLIIEVDQKHFGEFERFAYLVGWEKQKESFISRSL